MAEVNPGDPVPARVRNLPTWLVSRAHQRAHRLLLDALGEYGFRGYHYRLLAALEESGPASQIELGQRTGIDRSDVVGALNDLVDHELVERDIDAADRRRNVVTITPAGTARLSELDDVVARAQEEFLSPLSAAERRQLLRLLVRVGWQSAADDPTP